MSHSEVVSNDKHYLLLTPISSKFLFLHFMLTAGHLHLLLSSLPVLASVVVILKDQLNACCYPVSKLV